jgi:hypothetical protein
MSMVKHVSAKPPKTQANEKQYREPEDYRPYPDPRLPFSAVGPRYPRPNDSFNGNRNTHTPLTGESSIVAEGGKLWSETTAFVNSRDYLIKTELDARTKQPRNPDTAVSNDQILEAIRQLPPFARGAFTTVELLGTPGELRELKDGRGLRPAAQTDATHPGVLEIFRRTPHIERGAQREVRWPQAALDRVLLHESAHALEFQTPPLGAPSLSGINRKPNLWARGLYPPFFWGLWHNARQADFSAAPRDRKYKYFASGYAQTDEYEDLAETVVRMSGLEQFRPLTRAELKAQGLGARAEVIHELVQHALSNPLNPIRGAQVQPEAHWGIEQPSSHAAGGITTRDHIAQVHKDEAIIPMSKMPHVIAKAVQEANRKQAGRAHLPEKRTLTVNVHGAGTPDQLRQHVIPLLRSELVSVLEEMSAALTGGL